MFDGNYEIDWTHPLSRGLAHAWVLGEPIAKDLVGNLDMVAAGSPVYQVGPNGREADFLDSASNRYQYAGPPTKYAQSGFTVVVRGISETSNVANIIMGYGGSNNSNWALNTNTYNNTGRMGVAFGGVGDYASVALNNPAEHATFGAVMRSGKATLGLDGRTEEKTTGTPGLATGDVYLTIGCGRRSSFRNPMQGSADLALLYDRELTTAELSEITRDPSVVLVPTRRRFLATIIATNNPATGSITINGTPQDGQTLTATNTIADTDGLGTFTYAWLQDDVVIDGETSTTYDVLLADVGTDLKARISYTDGGGTDEVVISDAVTITATPNTYQQCHCIVTIDKNYVVGGNKNNFPFNLKSLPDGFIAGAEANGANIRIYTSSDFININRLAIDPSGGWDVEAETVDWDVSIPILTSSIDFDLYVVRTDPNNTLPADSAPYGKNEVTLAEVGPIGEALTETLDNMANNSSFSSFGWITCVTVGGVGGAGNRFMNYRGAFRRRSIG